MSANERSQPEREPQAEQEDEHGLTLNKDTLHDLDAAGEDGAVKGGMRTIPRTLVTCATLCQNASCVKCDLLL
jgi:hypothetical protein